MPTLITTNGHDDGYDLVEGPLVTGPVVGRISWEDGNDPGYVLSVNTTGTLHLSYPNSIAEVAADLAALGYDLETTSRDEINSLGV